AGTEDPETCLRYNQSVSSRSVLIVEDDEALLETTAMALGDQGHRVAVAATGAEAMANLERDVFDLVLLDLGLPDIKGLDLLETIRRRWLATTVIVAGQRRRMVSSRSSPLM